jgi:hypothetical protein
MTTKRNSYSPRQSYVHKRAYSMHAADKLVNAIKELRKLQINIMGISEIR